MGEAVQHLRTGAQRPDGLAVVFLIEEKACFLSFGHVYEISDAVFHNLHLGVKGGGQEAFDPGHSLLLPHFCVRALVNSPNGNAVLRHQFFQGFQNEGLIPIHAQRQRLHHQHVGELVHHQTGQEIRLAENHPAAAGVHHLFPVFPGVLHPHSEKILVDFLIPVPGQHPHPELGAAV